MKGKLFHVHFKDLNGNHGTQPIYTTSVLSARKLFEQNHQYYEVLAINEDMFWTLNKK